MCNECAITRSSCSVLLPRNPLQTSREVVRMRSTHGPVVSRVVRRRQVRKRDHVTEPPERELACAWRQLPQEVQACFLLAALAG